MVKLASFLKIERDFSQNLAKMIAAEPRAAYYPLCGATFAPRWILNSAYDILKIAILTQIF
jgi:hypothetical protein